MSATINPSAVSAANAQYKLWCTVEDDNAPFLVTVPTNAYIAELKKSIRVEGFNDSGPILAKDLTLWKVSTFYMLASPPK
jgi:hypothetical protein